MLNVIVLCFLLCSLNPSSLIIRYNTIWIFLSSFRDLLPCQVSILSIYSLSLLKEIWSFILKKGKTRYRIENSIGNYYSNCYWSCVTIYHFLLFLRVKNYMKVIVLLCGTLIGEKDCAWQIFCAIHYFLSQF